ncbi:MAG TPA: hypothetical protein VE959_28005 [Bryobacteraceae bacterium]|nr:hypothetical protein [Bryobacteraceae bacterium]
MADEQKPKGRKKPIEPETQDSVLAATAKAVGTAAGKIASLAGVAEPAPAPSQTKSMKQPKLQKKNRSRLPRRQKKAHQKVAATQGAV